MNNKSQTFLQQQRDFLMRQTSQSNDGMLILTLKIHIFLFNNVNIVFYITVSPFGSRNIHAGLPLVRTYSSPLDAGGSAISEGINSDTPSSPYLSLSTNINSSRAKLSG